MKTQIKIPVDIVIPAVGESITEATISEWSYPNGSQVHRDDVILVLETDKASVEIVAETSGVLTTLSPAGETIAIGTVVGTITPGEGEATTATAASDTPTSTTAATAGSLPTPESVSSPSQLNSTLSPAVQRIVGEKRLDPNQISGTGKHSQITKADALTAASQPQAKVTPNANVERSAALPTELLSTPPLPKSVLAEAPVESRQPMSRLRQTIARRLVEAQQTAAILTTFNEIDMSVIMDIRKKYKDRFQEKHSVKLGFMGFFMRASIEALKEFPLVNSSLDGTEILSRNYINMGIAVGTPKGLVVPVIKNASTLSLADLEKSLLHYATKARSGKISMDDLSGGTFTISNGGTYGSLLSTPILNPPQSGILGLHKIEERPIALNGEIVIRPMMYVALSYDHRIIDGSESVRFLVKIKECMENPATMLLDI
ncbi:2-oxoglutarate dehydrogenase complex dihydrolipoyllysine-residue succinyltransferase [Bdellovibrionales bacterium]|nr:2-oxoglutarate dehydrogenase complex dihydrolipoyllysine-residue succinyltransferase [Bdellovibrionales bacterium]